VGATEKRTTTNNTKLTRKSVFIALLTGNLNIDEADQVNKVSEWER